MGSRGSACYPAKFTLTMSGVLLKDGITKLRKEGGESYSGGVKNLLKGVFIAFDGNQDS
jgi:hypothetical protein